MVGKFALKNLSKCLDQEWEIPFDVSITVKSSEGKNVYVNAHKAILAMSSKVFKDNFFPSRTPGDPATADDRHLLIENCDESVVKMLVKYCYTGEDISRELPRKSVRFLIDLYCLADKFELEELQNLVLKQRKLSQLTKEDMDKSGNHCVLSSNDAFNLIEASFDMIEHEKLVDALFSRATSILMKEFFGRTEELTKFIREKVADENMLRFLLKKIGIDDACSNCKMVSCLNGSSVNYNNFQPGARVKVKNAKAGRGNAALVKLGQIVDRAKFNGFSASGLPIPNVKLEGGVYVFDCSQCLD